MLRSALIAAAVLAIAAPGTALAKSSGKSAASLENANGPIPYSELASVDAKINGASSGAKHHMAKKKASKSAASASHATGGASTSSDSSAPAK